MFSASATATEEDGAAMKQTPEDIGRAVVFLVSEDAKNITGQSLNVDGGMVMS